MKDFLNEEPIMYKVYGLETKCDEMTTVVDDVLFTLDEISADLDGRDILSDNMQHKFWIMAFELKAVKQANATNRSERDRVKTNTFGKGR